MPGEAREPIRKTRKRSGKAAAGPARVRPGGAEPFDLFRDLCENAHDLIQSVTPEGKFLYVNKAWTETLGYSRKEIENLNVFDVIHPDSHDHCRLVLQQLFAGKQAVDISCDFRTRDGRRVPLEGSARCRFENGRPVATRGIFRDVSRRRRAETELARLFHLSLDLLCIAGFDGYFKRINPAFVKLLGYTRQELLSRSFLEFVHPEDRRGTVAEMNRLGQGLPVVDFRNRYRGKDGRYHWLAWRAAPLLDQGEIYAVARDITEEKHSQEIMSRQAKELERSNADLEQFAYAASHDLQAPLRAIANLSEWIEEDLPGKIPEQVRGHLDQLRRRVLRMETLTEDLLRYSRAGRETGEIGTVDTAALVQEVVFLLDPPEGIRIETGPRMPVFETAKSPLEQVFRNLLGNAVKHHDLPRGRVLVSVRPRGRFYQFSVEDDGPGIPEEFRDRIFQMFQKLRPHDRVEGTGIGLALVRRIVEGQGGRLWLESCGVRGSVFHFTWPIRIGTAEDEHGDDSRRR